MKSVDAYSAVVGRWPIIVMTSRGDYYRQRWDIAHELGHLILHDSEVAISEQVEQEANQFAAELLLPAEQVADVLPTSAARGHQLIAELTPIKEHWGVSFRALLRRSRDLNRMHQSTFQYANRVLDDRGWRTYEPGKMQTLEMPHRLPEALARYIGYGADRNVILQEVGIPRFLFESIISRRPIDVLPNSQD